MQENLVSFSLLLLSVFPDAWYRKFSDGAYSNVIDRNIFKDNDVNLAYVTTKNGYKIAYFYEDENLMLRVIEIINLYKSHLKGVELFVILNQDYKYSGFVRMPIVVN